MRLLVAGISLMTTLLMSSQVFAMGTTVPGTLEYKTQTCIKSYYAECNYTPKKVTKGTGSYQIENTCMLEKIKLCYCQTQNLC